MTNFAFFGFEILGPDDQFCLFWPQPNDAILKLTEIASTVVPVDLLHL